MTQLTVAGVLEGSSHQPLGAHKTGNLVDFSAHWPVAEIKNSAIVAMNGDDREHSNIASEK